jgi:hypothetical protein
MVERKNHHRRGRDEVRRTRKQALTNAAKKAWRARAKKSRHNPIYYINTPWTRDQLWLMGFSDADLKNKKLVGEKIAENLGEAWVKSEKYFRNAFRCPHCKRDILY